MDMTGLIASWQVSRSALGVQMLPETIHKSVVVTHFPSDGSTSVIWKAYTGFGLSLKLRPGFTQAALAGRSSFLASEHKKVLRCRR